MAENRQGNGDNHSRIPDRAGSKVKTPKNVRQIGKIGDGLAIYVEDYVKTYTKQLAESDYTSRCIAVLVGEYRTSEIQRDVFLYGAIKVDYDEQDAKSIFNEETWTIIYEKIKQYFPEAEIVGWYYGGTGFGNEDLSLLEDIQMNNFAGRDKVLLTYDVLEKENNFYLFDGVSMIIQPGYYIYYEKNQEMQNYMVENKKIHREEDQLDDHAIREMRAILQDKKPPVTVEHEQKTMIRLGYAAGTLMMLVALIVGVSMISNNQRIDKLEETVSTYSQGNTQNGEENSKQTSNIFDRTEETGKKAGDKSTENSQGSSNSQTKVETQNSNLNQISPTPEVTKAATATPEPTAQPTQEVSQPTATPEPTIEPTQKPTDLPAVNPDTLVEYTVKAGDTLASICTRECGAYGYIAQVKEINKIENEDIIFIGQKLLLPPKK